MESNGKTTFSQQPDNFTKSYVEIDKLHSATTNKKCCGSLALVKSSIVLEFALALALIASASVCITVEEEIMMAVVIGCITYGIFCAIVTSASFISLQISKSSDFYPQKLRPLFYLSLLLNFGFIILTIYSYVLCFEHEEIIDMGHKFWKKMRFVILLAILSASRKYCILLSQIKN